MKRTLYILIFVAQFFMTTKSFSENIFQDNFNNQAEWEFITDNVMGGKSTGKIAYIPNDAGVIAVMSGNVTTENNGGFIQIRRKFNDISLNGATHIKILAKGNNQKYFIHLRTRGTILPWQYYQIGFEVEDQYKEYILPIQKFERSGSFLSKEIDANSIKSVGIVAFGRDHPAEIHIKEISFVE